MIFGHMEVIGVKACIFSSIWIFRNFEMIFSAAVRDKLMISGQQVKNDVFATGFQSVFLQYKNPKSFFFSPSCIPAVSSVVSVSS